MSDLAEVLNWRSPELSACLTRGLGTFGVPEPMTLDEWAAKHFYLSKESSYVEQAWEAWPFQRAIMACISNNDIREVDFMKSARVGYTKMLLAAIAYFIEHKRRNQALWQPTDGDSDEFVKTELETMLRDVKVMRKAFPSHMSRNKDNTLLQKKFLGCLLHTRCRLLGCLAFGRCRGLGAARLAGLFLLQALVHHRRAGLGLRHPDDEVTQHRIVEPECRLDLGQALLVALDVHQHVVRLACGE